MELTVNGSRHQVDVEPDTPLLWVLRDTLGMTGTKYGCGVSQCGACTVLIDGQATRSCVTTVDSVVGMAITTIEAIEQDAEGSKVVEAWVANQVPQCGYCQSGHRGRHRRRDGESLPLRHLQRDLGCRPAGRAGLRRFR
jgi:isoquinoline 1-oxidoreductase subunit alpha